AGDTLEREALISRLLRLGYRRASVVDIPGDFSVRGGIVDVYSTGYDEPVRVELLGDTIESLRHFDTATQKSTSRLPSTWIFPAREFIPPDDRGEALQPDAEWRSPDLYGT